MSTLVGLPSNTHGSMQSRFPDVRWRATFWRQDGTQIVTDVDSRQSNTGRASNDVISGTTQKSIASPIGTWSLRLVPRQEYFNLSPIQLAQGTRSAVLLPGDWCLIESDNGDGRGFRPLMYGPITDIRRTRTTLGNGTVQQNVMICGADFGKALARIATVVDTTLAQQTVLSASNIAFIARGLQQTSGAPEDILQAILSHYLFDIPGQMIDPRTGRTFGAQDLDLGYITAAATRGKALIQPINLAGTLWQTLEQWCNPLINELFTDLRPKFGNQNDFINLVPAIVLREYPFFGSAWNNLTSVQVDRSECIYDDLGRSDGDVRNWLRPMDEPQLGQFNGQQAIFNGVGAFMPESMKRFGIIRDESPTLYTFDPDSQQGNPIKDLLETFCGLLTLWHHSNERLISGQLDLYHRPEIRVGYRLDYNDPEQQEHTQFYIESVRQMFNYPNGSGTSVVVTRGRDPNDKRFTSDLATLKSQGIVEELGDTITRIQQALKDG